MKFSKALATVLLAVLPVLLFVLEEGWIIAITGFFGIWVGIPLVTLVLFIPTVAISWALDQIRLPEWLRRVAERWKGKQQEEAETRLERTRKTAIWISLVVASIVVSPSLSAAMVNLLGVQGKRAQLYNLSLTVVCAIFWCGVYGGGWLAVRMAYHHYFG